MWQNIQRFSERRPTLAATAGALATLVVCRLVWVAVWWLFLAPPALLALSGDVTCDGVPITEGTISLEPIGQRGISSRTSSIRDGRFTLAKAYGVRAGVEYLVRVEAFRKTGKTYPGPKPGEYSEEYEQIVASRFNRDSDRRLRMSSEISENGVRIDVASNKGP